MDDQSYESGGTDPTITFTTREFGPDELEELAISQLEHALDARRRGLKTYESLKNLNDVIGTQYGDRVVFELIQNAHDAHPKDDLGEVAVRLVLEDESHGKLLVANRGRNFGFSNLDSIRNIGTSDKEIGEGIGNKGLGFRSVEALTDDPRIYSQSEGCRGGRFAGYCFRFASSDEIKSRLEKLGAPSDLLSNLAENISRYLVPLPTKEQSEEVLKLAESGFATVVELPLKSAETVELARKQVAAIGSQDAPILLFLERLTALDIEVRGGGAPSSRIRMTRRVTNVQADLAAKPITLHEVELDGRSSFLVVRRVLPKAALLEAVKESIPVAPALKRWLDWKGDAVVSVAVSLKNESVTTSRLFNFLPMDEKAVAPFHGYLDAPFFADIDRRSMHPDLPLNRHLLEAAADACAATVLLITQNGLKISKYSVVDLITWAQPHVKKITDAFKRMDQDFTKIKIWPIVSDGGHPWGSLDCLYAWPEISTKYLKPRRLADVAGAEILLPELGERRTVRIRRLAANMGMPMDLTANALCAWVVDTANAMAEAKATRSSQWADFYEDIALLFKGNSIDLGELRGKAFLRGATGQLLKSATEGQLDEEKVFVRHGETKGRKTLGPPKPPSSISRKLKFLDESIPLSDETFQSFQKAALLRKYDALEVLRGLSVALGKTPTDSQRTDALTWAFKVWRSTGGGRAVDDALRVAKLFVPTRSGWTAASEALLSSSWTSLGKLLESFLLDASEHSKDCSIQSSCLLLDYQNWPSASVDDKKSDWLKFLDVIGVQDGLRPIAATIRRGGTPSNYWHRLFASGAPALGLGPAWVTDLVGVHLTYPQTDYQLVGECWRIPGQLEHSALPQTARETLSELIVAYLKEHGDEHFSFSVQHWKGFEKEAIPTPLQIFLRDGEWALAFRRDEAVLRRPRDAWSSQTARQVPPRFVERFAAEPGNRGAIPPVLFDKRVGLRDWTSPDTAGQRLVALADAVVDLSAAERRELRDQLRRAWSDVSATGLDLPLDLPLVVERNNGLDVCRATAVDAPVVYLTSERQGFAARALVDQGAAVLDLGASDPGKVSALLSKTNGFDLRSVDTVDVRMIVDGNAFEPTRSSPLLVAGALGWIADAAVLAHEFLGDPLELRTLPPETLEQRIRQIRVWYCRDFSLVIGDQVVSASGREQVQPFIHSQLPTLIIARVEIDLSLLISAAPALTKLVGARRNTLETMLTRLERSGFTGRDGGPTEEQYARAIQREIAIVRDHFAATKGGVERRVRFLLPAICCIAGDAAVDRLSEAHSKLGPSLQLRDWLAREIGEELAENVWTAIADTEDQSVVMKRLGISFADYNAALKKLGYPPLNSEDDFRRLFEVYLNELRPQLLDRIRRRHLGAYRRGDSLRQYLEHRSLDFIPFDSNWVITVEELDRGFVERYVHRLADLELGPDNDAADLDEIKRLTSANQKTAQAAHARMASLVRAWCRKNAVERPQLMDPSDAQPLVRALERSGLLDFERFLPDQLPSVCSRIDAWPSGMPQTLDPIKLSLDDADIDFEEREAREARRRSEVARRSITFGGEALDTGSSDFSQVFAELAEHALSASAEWFARSRPARLELQEQPEPGRDKRKGRGGDAKGGARRDQPPEHVLRAMGVASEYLAREYLMKRHPKEMSDRCWVSRNREAFCPDGEKGDDSLGYDFRVVTARNEMLYEVKSALDAGGEFELTARELEVAGSAAADGKRRYRLLYVPFVFDPDRWRVLTLANPAAESTRNRYRVIRTGSVRYGFDIK